MSDRERRRDNNKRGQGQQRGHHRRNEKNNKKDEQPTTILTKSANSSGPDNVEFPTLTSTLTSTSSKKEENVDNNSISKKSGSNSPSLDKLQLVNRKSAIESALQQQQQSKQQQQAEDVQVQERGCRLIEDPSHAFNSETFPQFLSNTNHEFMVMGVMGAQGVGKANFMW